MPTPLCPTVPSRVAVDYTKVRVDVPRRCLVPQHTACVPSGGQAAIGKKCARSLRISAPFSWFGAHPSLPAVSASHLSISQPREQLLLPRVLLAAAAVMIGAGGQPRESDHGTT